MKYWLLHRFETANFYLGRQFWSYTTPIIDWFSRHLVFWQLYRYDARYHWLCETTRMPWPWELP